MNLAFKYPLIFWNCACLITDAGGSEDIDTDGKNNNYDKIASAIGKMISAGIKVVPPNINKSSYSFLPDVENNQILFGLRGLINVGENVIKEIVDNRPYASFENFLSKTNIGKQAMITLIKGGAFDELEDRYKVMVKYIWHTCNKKNRITLQNMSALIKYQLLPESLKTSIRVYEFNRYVKSLNKGATTTYKLDTRSIEFLNELSKDNLIGNDLTLNIKSWDKVYQDYMDSIRTWIANNKDKILEDLNTQIFLEDWKKYATGNLSSWEMDSLCFYYHEHELAKVQFSKYGIQNFTDLSPTPTVDKIFKKDGKDIPIYKIQKICGTCIAKDKAKGTVHLLTIDGVVPIRFRKEYFSMFDKQISEKQSDGTKKVLEKSWFNRGNKILVQGIRQENEFIAKTYSATPGHTLYRIDEILENGEILLRHDRLKGAEEEDEEN